MVSNDTHRQTKPGDALVKFGDSKSVHCMCQYAVKKNRSLSPKRIHRIKRRDNEVYHTDSTSHFKWGGTFTAKNGESTTASGILSEWRCYGDSISILVPSYRSLLQHPHSLRLALSIRLRSLFPFMAENGKKDLFAIDSS